MKIQKDVATALTLRHIFIFLRPVVWYLFFAVVILEYIVFGEYSFEYTDFLAYPAAAFIILFPILRGWIKSAWRDRNYVGKVISMKGRKVDELVGVTKTRHRKVSFYLDFEIKTESGKIRKFTVEEPSYFHTDYIKVGDMVRHIKGSKQLEKVNKSGDTDVLCVVCGDLCRMENHLCFNCRHSLLKRSGIYT